MPPCPAPSRGDIRCRALLCAGAPGGGVGGGGAGHAAAAAAPRRCPFAGTSSAGEPRVRGGRKQPSVQQPAARARALWHTCGLERRAGGTAGGDAGCGWVGVRRGTSRRPSAGRAAPTAAPRGALAAGAAEARGAADFAAGRERAGVRTVTNARCAARGLGTARARWWAGRAMRQLYVSRRRRQRRGRGQGRAAGASAEEQHTPPLRPQTLAHTRPH